MVKHITDFIIEESTRLTQRFQLMKLKAPSDIDLSSVKPGQFVQIKVDNSPSTFLRRPISINDVDVTNNLLHILVARAGDGTNAICDMEPGQNLNLMWPLGNGFTLPDNQQATNESFLLAGGGVGTAPLLYLGKKLKEIGARPHFLLAAKTAGELMLLDSFSEVGTVYTSTDDGSAGEPGLITQNSSFNRHFDNIYCCGPMPMMKAIAKSCKERGINCEVSLENSMACGIGACLCCVEKTVKGNRCVCTEGPVFNITELTW